MIFHASAHCEATESVGIHDRTDLATSVLYTSEYRADGLYVHGIPSDRAAFLRRLAAAAIAAADELDAIPAVKPLVVQP